MCFSKCIGNIFNGRMFYLVTFRSGISVFREILFRENCHTFRRQDKSVDACYYGRDFRFNTEWFDVRCSRGFQNILDGNGGLRCAFGHLRHCGVVEDLRQEFD